MDSASGKTLVAHSILWISLVFAFGLTGTTQNTRTSLGDHYLLLVSYLKPSTMNQARLSMFDSSAYDGVAVAFIGPYDDTPPPSAEEITAKMAEAGKWTKKDLWPWVYVNRMVGRDPGFNTSYGRTPYFSKIRGADLEDATGAQGDFVKIWQNSLHAAKSKGVPGIVVDLEFYMNYKAYDPTVLAQQMGRDPKTTIELLKRLGARLADTAAKEYSDAVLWLLFTDLGQAGTIQSNGTSYYPSPAYVAMGLLDQIKSNHYSLKVISGGEVGLGYCSRSLSHLQRKIKQRAVDFAKQLQKYSANLELGGTIILWSDRRDKTDFVNEGDCAKSDADTVEQLQPYLEILLRSYRYNWVYGTYNSGYDPFHPRSAPRFDAVIGRARKNVQSNYPH